MKTNLILSSPASTSSAWANEGRPVRALLLHLAAAVLSAAGERLHRVAARAAAADAALAHAPRFVEFHSVHRDAGAPEGALYVDGKLVGFLDVTRL